MKVGFIGVGSMGSVMVPHLVKAGHTVSVWNLTPEEVRRIKGVQQLRNPRDAFRNDVVLTMLANDEAVRSVILDSGALEAASHDCVHVIMATISPQLVDELQQAHKKANVPFATAPVFGIPSVAAKGELNIMTAGDPDALKKAQPLFDVLGKKTWPLGTDPKQANVAKLAGNMMIALAIESLAEAFALTRQYGLNDSAFLELVTSTIFECSYYKHYGSNIVGDSYEPGFQLALGLKDIKLALNAASFRDRVLPSVEIVRQSMEAAVQSGEGTRDWSALAKGALRNLTRLDPSATRS
jgi:3-hydroxyisobutyrate dehydrogenase-like beta-hydroxyacid dehydrogenase